MRNNEQKSLIFDRPGVSGAVEIYKYPANTWVCDCKSMWEASYTDQEAGRYKKVYGGSFEQVVEDLTAWIVSNVLEEGDNYEISCD